MTRKLNRIETQRENVNGSEGGWEWPNQSKGNRRKHECWKILDLIPIEFDRRFNPNPKIARVVSVLVHRTHGVPNGEGTAITRRRPSIPGLERTGTSSDDSVARQRALVSDAFDDE